MSSYPSPFLQSAAWATFQRALGREVIERQGDGWSYLAIVERGKLSSRLYCPYGPIVESTAAFKHALQDLKSEAKKRRLLFVRMDPVGKITEAEMRKSGLTRSHKDFQPAHTVVNDLTMSQDDILAAVSQTDRRIWRKNQNEGVEFEVSYDPSDVKSFIEMMHDVSLRTGMHPFSDTYFQTTAKSLFPIKAAGLMFAKLNGKRVAGILFYSNGETMYYAHAASFSEYRKLSPTTSLALYALLYAAENGHKAYDFCGVAPEGADDSHSWSGFTAFKLSFGGHRASTLGTWEYPINKSQYKLYRLLLRLTKKL